MVGAHGTGAEVRPRCIAPAPCHVHYLFVRVHDPLDDLSTRVCALAHVLENRHYVCQLCREGTLAAPRPYPSRPAVCSFCQHKLTPAQACCSPWRQGQPC